MIKQDTIASRMISEFYDDMDHDSKKEAFSMKISVSGQVSDVSMLDAIASHFGQTRTSIVADLLHNSVLEMYFALTLEDKQALSLVADTETSNQYAKKGITQTYCGVGLDQGETTDKDMTWRSYTAMVKTSLEKNNADS